MSVPLALKTFTRDTNSTGLNSQDYIVSPFLQRIWNREEKDIIHANLDNEHAIIRQLAQMLTTSKNKNRMTPHQNINTLMMRKTQTTLKNCRRIPESTKPKWTKNRNDLNDSDDADEDHLESNNQHLWQKKRNLANKTRLTGRALTSRSL